MSQILDALKRSEAARAQSTETPVALAPVWRTARRRPLWPLWLGLLVMGVLAAGVWQNRSELWPERFAEPEEESSKQTSPESVAEPAPAPADPVAAVPPPEMSEPNPAEAIQPDPAAPAEIAELAPTAPMIQPGDVAVPTGPDSPDTEVTELAPMAGKDTMPIPDVMPEVPNPAMVTPPAEAPAPVIEPAPAQVTAPTLPVYTDLPYSLRRDLPVLRFSTYRYHDDPGQRFVVYQERRVSEQGVLGQELWLREIHPDYLVLDFRGTLFTVPR